MRVLILGCGYVGMAVMELLVGSGHDVSVTTTRGERVKELAPKCKEVVVLEGNDKKSLRAALEEQDVLVVTVAPYRGGDYQTTYYETAQTIRDVLPETSVKQVVYTSSTSVYGEWSGQWVDETTELHPSTLSGEILAKTEGIYLNDLPEHVAVSILRLAGIYGPGRDPAQRLKRLQGKILPGDGRGYSNWTHRNDAAAAIVWAIEQEADGVYNVCGDDHLPRKSVYEALAKKLDLEAPQWDPTATSAHGGNRRVSNEKIKKAGFAFSEPHLSFLGEKS